MKKEEIINALKNDEEYYNGIGKKYLSASDIGTLVRNPKNFGISEPKSKELLEGTYFHKYILEREKLADMVIVDASTRNTNIYKAAIEQSGEECLLLQSEADAMAELACTIISNPVFFDEIYDEGNQFEVPMIGEIFGLPFKGKADVVRKDFLIDLKTTSDINDFRWSAKKYNYDSQCYVYQCLFGLPLYFIVACKKTKMLGIYKPSQEFINNGRDKVLTAVENYHKFFGPNRTHDVNQYYFDEIL
jgi:hypothetical protein